MKNFLYKFIDVKNENSLSNRLRRKRFELFKNFIGDLNGNLKILDIGGTYSFWEQMGLASEQNIHFTLVNLQKEENLPANFVSYSADARDLSQFEDNSFDVVFSNSTIEHLSDYESQKRMANEIKRLAKRYFVQTPNKFFPVEPHFVFPFFQFFPLELKIFLLQNFALGNFEKIKDRQKAQQTCEEIVLLSEDELRELFDGAEIFYEKYFGLTKSFIAYKK